MLLRQIPSWTPPHVGQVAERAARPACPWLPSQPVSSPPPFDLARKVRQLDNDVQSIYEMLAGIAAQQARQVNRLDEIAAQQASQGEQLARLEEQVAAVLNILRRGQP